MLNRAKHLLARQEAGAEPQVTTSVVQQTVVMQVSKGKRYGSKEVRQVIEVINSFQKI
jgi:hypothetical protein